MKRTLVTSLLGLFLVAGLSSSVASQPMDLFKVLDVQRVTPPMEAPEFTTEMLDGKKVSLQDYRGKVVFLNFWASWCKPCKEEMPAMEELYQAFKDKGFVVVAVNVKESQKQAAAFVKELKVTYPILLDPKGDVSVLYGAWALPLTYLIDRKGVVVGRAFGPREWAGKEARQLIAQLLKGS
ncbi:MAG: TlpA family protein disulfide reductase [candidate division NC10 bacterium]|nr:TlpA family protein disulfide reductase [candidate division NC10 bacterium]